MVNNQAQDVNYSDDAKNEKALGTYIDFEVVAFLDDLLDGQGLGLGKQIIDAHLRSLRLMTEAWLLGCLGCYLLGWYADTAGVIGRVCRGSARRKARSRHVLSFGTHVFLSIDMDTVKLVSDQEEELRAFEASMSALFLI